MTRDDIISMAREAGASFETAESMFSFAALVAAEERKEILNEIIAKYLNGDWVFLTPNENKCVKLIVKRIDFDIRSRCEKS